MPGLIQPRTSPQTATGHWQAFASKVLSYSISVYESASEIPDVVWKSLEEHPQNANVILPHALKRLFEERNGKLPTRGEFWMVYYSHYPSPTVDFILSCTEGPLGSYPVFIFTPHPYERLEDWFIRPRIHLIVQELLRQVDRRRIYSVFAPEPVTMSFAQYWCFEAKMTIDRDIYPYYAALIKSCTKSTFVNRQMTRDPNYDFELRPAVESDIPYVADLCYGFAADAAPFELTWDRALEEATLLVRTSQAYVHAIRRCDETTHELASIVAVTRTSDSVSTITKVFTNPRWRRIGCAERLVRYVCKRLLMEKESIVLYVAHNNPTACNVYERVGFTGLDEHNPLANDIDRWLEIGFDKSRTFLGHW